MRKIHHIGKFEVEEFDSNIFLAKNIICDDFLRHDNGNY